MTKDRPFVFINMAMTADGKIATAHRRASSFSSERDQNHLLELRAQADAVMVGARTADENPIYLGPGPLRFRRRRLAAGLAEFNLRILVSGSGTINPQAEVFKRRFSPIVLLTTKRISPARLRKLRALVDEVRICGNTAIDFEEALCWLKTKWGVQRLLGEGGGELNDTLFRAGCVDELHLTICPLILGGTLAPTIADGLGAQRLRDGTELALRSRQRVGDELFLVYQVLPRTS